ncbi:hypothetical protein [Methanolobus psychrotolerans]|nr:hypothetical protein [Methanolobus psychrotolerans]
MELKNSNIAITMEGEIRLLDSLPLISIIQGPKKLNFAYERPPPLD